MDEEKTDSLTLEVIFVFFVDGLFTINPGFSSDSEMTFLCLFVCSLPVHLSPNKPT